ncbi:hypothetical protein O181_041540 [Austropuccinia psidii MF-1]|uniref:Uncharacterized protein n=1 Tax=Austropuccinia psidii MF-1 TaxID=1389203 RepID=A0A9Q3DF17_9BASI|nr:hypothetical protein [Austropuccinia psidii MF-1]
MDIYRQTAFRLSCFDIKTLVAVADEPPVSVRKAFLANFHEQQPHGQRSLIRPDSFLPSPAFVFRLRTTPPMRCSTQARQPNADANRRNHPS